jgi:hypothetical protein
MDALVIDTIIDKVNAGDKRLEANEKLVIEMDKKLSGFTDQSGNQKHILGLIMKLQDEMTEIRWPVNQIAEMSSRLKQNNDLLANPVKTKHTIVHTAGKLGWIIAGLSVVIISLVILLINVGSKMDHLKMNDMMWRYIKIGSHSQNLEYLHQIERTYLDDPEKMQSEVEKEELHLKQIAESEINNPDPNASDTASTLNKRKKPKPKVNRK